MSWRWWLQVPPSASDGDSEVDPADLKTAAMAELKRRREIAKGKRRADTAEPRKCKFQSASVVDDSGDEGAAMGPSTPKRLKTEPVPQSKDKVLKGNGT